MFITNFKFKTDIDDGLLAKLKEDIAKAFHNRCGIVEGKEINKYELVYQSEEYAPYSLGITENTYNKELIEHLAFWDWNDTEVPDEYTDLLEDMKTWTC